MAVDSTAGLICSIPNGTGKDIAIRKCIRVVVGSVNHDISESGYIHTVDFKTYIDCIIGHYPVRITGMAGITLHLQAGVHVRYMGASRPGKRSSCWRSETTCPRNCACRRHSMTLAAVPGK
jgi:hypothetical protein